MGRDYMGHPHSLARVSLSDHVNAYHEQCVWRHRPAVADAPEEGEQEKHHRVGGAEQPDHHQSLLEDGQHIGRFGPSTIGQNPPHDTPQEGEHTDGRQDGGRGRER